MENAEFSYSNDDALNDGIFADVTPASMKEDGWQWIVTASVHEKFSLAAIAELFNEMVTHYNKTKETFTTGTMNGEKMFLMLEGDDKGTKVFKICFPSEY